MIKKVIIDNNIVHGVYGLNDDFTFCTIEILNEAHESFQDTNRKITCEDCLRIVKYYKSIKASEFKKTC